MYLGAWLWAFQMCKSWLRHRGWRQEWWEWTLCRELEVVPRATFWQKLGSKSRMYCGEWRPFEPGPNQVDTSGTGPSHRPESLWGIAFQWMPCCIKIKCNWIDYKVILGAGLLRDSLRSVRLKDVFPLFVSSELYGSIRYYASHRGRVASPETDQSYINTNGAMSIRINTCSFFFNRPSSL